MVKSYSSMISSISLSVLSASLSASVLLSTPLVSASEQAGPVAHSPARDQGDVGFCWSYASMGLIEGEALKKGIQVTLSPEYVGFYSIADEIENLIPTYQNLAKKHSKLLEFFIRELIQKRFHPQEGASGMDPVLAELAQVGVVPETVFNLKFPTVKMANGTINPDDPLEDRLTTFALKQLMDEAALAHYASNPQALYDDLGPIFGKQPPKPSDTFQFQGATYTPVSFLTDYLHFDPTAYQEVKVTQQNHTQALAILEKALQDNIAVPVGFIVYNDQKNAEKTGTFDVSNCSGRCKVEGGHEVLAIGFTQEPGGSGDTLLIKNSWGNIGLNDLGVKDTDPSQTGFFLIKNDYLASTEARRFINNSWSFVVPKSYIK